MQRTRLSRTPDGRSHVEDPAPPPKPGPAASRRSLILIDRWTGDAGRAPRAKVSHFGRKCGE